MFVLNVPPLIVQAEVNATAALAIATQALRAMVVNNLCLARVHRIATARVNVSMVNVCVYPGTPARVVKWKQVVCTIATNVVNADGGNVFVTLGLVAVLVKHKSMPKQPVPMAAVAMAFVKQGPVFVKHSTVVKIAAPS